MDAVIVELSLTSCARSDLFVAGKHIDGIARGARSVLIHDLRRSPVSEIRDPFHVLIFIYLVEYWRRWSPRNLVRRSTTCRYSLRPQADKIRRLNTLLKRRIEIAREMLLNPRLSLLDIALACGFADQSHFTRVFTAAMEVSPWALRRALELSGDPGIAPSLTLPPSEEVG
jgi:AraC-like DNA-binding protein